jgi:hypothetical protein
MTPDLRYIGGSLADLDKFAKDNGLKLEVEGSVTGTQIKKYHAILHSCFNNIKKDFPDATFSINEIKLRDERLGGYRDEKTFIFKGRLLLLTLSTAQTCYNTMYNDGIN